MTPESAPVEQADHDVELGKDEITRNNQNMKSEEEIDGATRNDPPTAPSLQESSPPPEKQPQNLSQNTTMSVIRQRREYCLQITNLVLRFAALLFSFLSFVIIAADSQSFPLSKFDYYEEYKYLISIGVIAFVYSALQLSRAIFDFVTGTTVLPDVVSSYVDFICDQLFAYLLISCSSAAAALTNGLQDFGDTKFTDMAAASVSMAFICFVVVVASSLISGFKLCKRIISW